MDPRSRPGPRRSRRGADQEGGPPIDEHRLEVELSTEQALAAVEEAADQWGASWEPRVSGGRLGLPVVRGLHRGVLMGSMTVEPTATGGSVIQFAVEESHQSVNRPAFLVLLLGALGAGTVVLWPLYPPLLTFAPVGVVLALAAWLLVASRLRTSGPEDFLELVATVGRQLPADPES